MRGGRAGRRKRVVAGRLDCKLHRRLGNVTIITLSINITSTWACARLNKRLSPLHSQTTNALKLARRSSISIRAPPMFEFSRAINQFPIN